MNSGARDPGAGTLERVSDYPAEVIVDLAAIRANIHTLREAAPTAQVMAVVKADAYGHGLVPVARAALQGGATWLGVAQLIDALALRREGIEAPLLAWLYTPGAPLAAAVSARVDLSVSAHWALDEVARAAQSSGRTARIHLKVDTGMGRGGVFPDAWEGLVDAAMAAQATGAVQVVGVWSHLARADEVGHRTIAAQTEAFTAAVGVAEAAGAYLEVRHLANSAGALTAPATHFDLVRPGIATYGLTPAPEYRSAAEFGLTPAMRMEAQVALVKDAPAGQGISYAHLYTTTGATRLAVIPLGYADGIPRHASTAGPVGVGGRTVPIAGRVCMDQFTLDLGPDGPSVRAGDRAILFGTGSGGEPTAQDWADAAGTISYEIVTRIAARIPRTYLNA